MKQIIPSSGSERKELYSLKEYILLHWNSIIKRFKTTEQLRRDLQKAKNYYQKLSAIRSYYRRVEPQLLKHHRERPTQFYDSYPTDWSLLFSPIERMAWDAIRCKGGIVLYPQYPALEYFLDFANPGLKIALELDGKHHDKDRDFFRDQDLKRAGWTIYRITGREMHGTFRDWSDFDSMTEENEKMEALTHWILKTGDGVIEAIKQIHFNHLTYSHCYDEEDEEVDYAFIKFYESCIQTLELHKS